MYDVYKRLIDTWDRIVGGHISLNNVNSDYWGLLNSASDPGGPKWDGAMSSILPAGDADLDGKVTAADLAIVQANMGKANAWWRQGDFNHDRVVNQADLDILKGALGPIVDPGFEQKSVGAGQYRYAPTGSPWPSPSGAGHRGQRQRLHRRQPAGPGGHPGRLPPEDRLVQPGRRRLGRRHLPADLLRRPAGQLPGRRGRTSGSWSTACVVGTFTPSGTSYQALHDRRLHRRGRVAHRRVPGPGHRRRRQHRLHRRRRGRRQTAHADLGRRRASSWPCGWAPASTGTARRARPGLRRRRRHRGQRQRLHRRQPAGPGGHPGRLPPEDRLVQPGGRRLGRRLLPADLLRRPAGQLPGRRGRTSRSWSTASSSARSPPPGTAYQSYTTAAFTVAAGSHTVTFQGLDTAGGDNTAFIDKSSSGRVDRALVPVGDCGLRAGRRWAPASTGTTRRARPGPSPAAPGSRATAAASPPATRRPRRAPRSPSSRRPARSARPSPAGPPAPTRSPSRPPSAATSQASRQDFHVLVDGVVVGTFTPAGTSYQTYTTAAFSVTAGSHTDRLPGPEHRRRRQHRLHRRCLRLLDGLAPVGLISDRPSLTSPRRILPRTAALTSGCPVGICEVCT